MIGSYTSIGESLAQKISQTNQFALLKKIKFLSPASLKNIPENKRLPFLKIILAIEQYYDNTLILHNDDSHQVLTELFTNIKNKSNIINWNQKLLKYLYPLKADIKDILRPESNFFATNFNNIDITEHILSHTKLSHIKKLNNYSIKITRFIKKTIRKPLQISASPVRELSFQDRKLIMQEMIKLNKIISTSETANIVNGDNISSYVLQIYNKINDISRKLINETTNRLYESKEVISQDNLIAYFCLFYAFRNMICLHFAMFMAAKLKLLLPHLSDQIYVCNYAGHSMISIGDPSNPKSLIVDPWIKYLNLKNRPDNLPDSAASDRDRGFMGNQKSYLTFLKKHPNIYTNMPYTLEINTHCDLYVNILKDHITQIENAYTWWFTLSKPPTVI